jgi:hypothetical protein
LALVFEMLGYRSLLTRIRGLVAADNVGYYGDLEEELREPGARIKLPPHQNSWADSLGSGSLPS